MDNGFVLEGFPHGYSYKGEVGNKSRRHKGINDTAVLWYQLPSFDFSKAVTNFHSYIERAGQIFRLRYAFTRKKNSEIWVHSEALAPRKLSL